MSKTSVAVLCHVMFIDISQFRNVGPVDLPEPFSAPATPDTTVSGWGTTSVDGGLSDVLLQVTIPIVSDEECREDYRFFGQIYDSNMCAGEEGHDHCYVCMNKMMQQFRIFKTILYFSG